MFLKYEGRYFKKYVVQHRFQIWYFHYFLWILILFTYLLKITPNRYLGGFRGTTQLQKLSLSNIRSRCSRYVVFKVGNITVWSLQWYKVVFLIFIDRLLNVQPAGQ